MRAEPVAAIHAETEGNPLFVGEVVRLLAAEGDLAGGHAEIRQASRGDRRAAAHLSEDCTRVLRWLPCSAASSGSMPAG